jgi:hypothetical protein
MILAQEIKYQRPVYLEDRLILEAEIIAEHHSVNVIELACKFRKEIDGKIVASAKVHVNRVRL